MALLLKICEYYTSDENVTGGQRLVLNLELLNNGQWPVPLYYGSDLPKTNFRWLD